MAVDLLPVRRHHGLPLGQIGSAVPRVESFHGGSQAVRGQCASTHCSTWLLIGIGCARSRPRSAPGSRSRACPGCVARGSGRCVRDDQLRRDLPVAEAICDQGGDLLLSWAERVVGNGETLQPPTQGDIASVRASGTAARQRSWQRPGLRRVNGLGEQAVGFDPKARRAGLLAHAAGLAQVLPSRGPVAERTRARSQGQLDRPQAGRGPPPPTTYRPR